MANEIEVKIPDIGGATQVDVIEVMVKVGDVISKETPLITLETDKATMEIPSPIAGTITKIIVKVGDKIAEGDSILFVSAEESIEPEKKPSESKEPDVKETKVVEEIKETQPKESVETPQQPLATESIEYTVALSAGPAVRRMARELGVNLTLVKGSGRKTRITKEDLQSYVKARLSEKPMAGVFNGSSTPAIDFTKFGEIETKPLSKIKKLTGINVHRSWITIPHVTQFDEADITSLEAFRQSESEKAQASGYKLTLLAFVCAAVSKALQVYPQFNASLDPSGENLIYKKYCNIGIAVETPNGLVVPVIKNANQMSVSQLASEMARLSKKARETGLSPVDMSGGCFTISSLGGIGGTAFTPIVNSPEVAILGLSRSATKPVFINGEFVPRLMLPLSLSYDHRVIDGAEAARFTRFVAEALSDIRRILL